MKVLYIVMAVIIGLILMALLFPSAGTPTDSRIVRAQNDTTLLKTALIAYLGEYDQPLKGDNTTLLKILQGSNPKGIVFIEPEQKQISKEGIFLDPWGSPYVFGCNDQRKAWAYSFGKNRIDEGGHGDDPNSWQ